MNEHKFKEGDKVKYQVGNVPHFGYIDSAGFLMIEDEKGKYLRDITDTKGNVIKKDVPHRRQPEHCNLCFRTDNGQFHSWLDTSEKFLTLKGQTCG